MIPHVSSGSSSATQSLIALRERRFQKLDQDGDGKITKDEMTAAKPKNGKGPSVDDLFSKIDTDQDGAIDQAEDQAAMEKMRAEHHGRRPAGPPPDAAKLAENIFKSADGDSDGKITLSALESTKQDDSPSAEDILKAVDSDQDGSITQTELTKFLEDNAPQRPGRHGGCGYCRDGSTAEPGSSVSQFSATA